MLIILGPVSRTVSMRCYGNLSPPDGIVFAPGQITQVSLAVAIAVRTLDEHNGPADDLGVDDLLPTLGHATECSVQ